MDGKSAGKGIYLYNETLRGFASDLLAGTDSFYIFPAAWDVSRLLTAFQGENAWPPVWGMVLSVLSADAEWQERAQPHFIKLETRLGVWLNSYVESTTGQTEDGVDYTQLDFTIPGAAVKAEIKQLLVDFYGDGELLTLMREIVSPQAAAAYLQPEAMNGLFLMVDALGLGDDLILLRRYDAKGQALLDEITLPFGEGGPLTQVKISAVGAGQDQGWRIEGTAKSGVSLCLSFRGAGEGVYTGSADLTLPPRDDSFVVSDQMPESTVLSFDYNLEWEIGEEQYSLTTDKFEKAVKGTLVLKPRENTALPAQSLTLEAGFSSGSAQRSATRLDGTLIWRDLEGDAQIKAVLDSRTVAPFQAQSLDGAEGLRLDQLDDQSLSALAARWLESSEDWAESLRQQLMTPASAQPSI